MNDEFGEKKPSKRLVETKHILIAVYVVAMIIVAIWWIVSNVPPPPSTVTVTRTITSTIAYNSNTTYAYSVQNQSAIAPMTIVMSMGNFFTAIASGPFLVIAIIFIMIYMGITVFGHRDDRY